jgi:hypothetical protein
VTIATCPECNNTGAIGERYCDCPVAMALRARIDNDPAVQAARARIDYLLDQHSSPAIVVPVGVDAIESVRAYEAAGVTWPQLRAARKRPAD